MTLDHTSLIDMYRALAGTRLAEQTITDLAHRGILPGHHSGLGHEAIGVGVGMALRPYDRAQMSHRSAMMLAHARGGYSLREAILAKFGRCPGCFVQLDGRPRVFPIVGLVGTWVPMSVGAAMADQLRGKDAVTVTFFGDGAANEGAVHEAMNLAGARQLPVVFVIENNGMAVSMSTAQATAATELASRAAGYGMPGCRVDGQDAVAVYRAASKAVSLARSGGGPSLIEAIIQRWEGHAVGIKDLRTQQQVDAARSRDGVGELRARLLRDGILDEALASAIEAQCRREIDLAVEECLRPAAIEEPEPIGPLQVSSLVFAP